MSPAFLYWVETPGRADLYFAGNRVGGLVRTDEERWPWGAEAGCGITLFADRASAETALLRGALYHYVDCVSH